MRENKIKHEKEIENFTVILTRVKITIVFKLFSLMENLRSPTSTIFKSNEVLDTLAPVVPSFSSRSPNNATLEILKPNLVAPGVDIIASWPTRSPISENLGENRNLKFNIMSITSMFCPHVSRATTYIKLFYPTWSLAVIRSTLMTTAKQMSPKDNHGAEFAYGAGQIDSLKALNPGLIYEANEGDYICFLCGQGFNETTLQLITEEKIICSEIGYATAGDLNYPLFAFKAPHPKHYLSGSFERTVTNV
ncbi:subtilisin-like serine protease [Medicago truncatula]|uniref:Subtilisin-like serine protease n=1 Tax=Medicago truncatula TaxID=3880 RepID=A0A072V304_MEDTR|nr:subtilisin-like serine protease [Medicago truncatula]